jgi:hypothetical protein
VIKYCFLYCIHKIWEHASNIYQGRREVGIR